MHGRIFGGAPPSGGREHPCSPHGPSVLFVCLFVGNSGPSCRKPWFRRPDLGDHLSLRQVNLLRHHTHDFATTFFASLDPRVCLNTLSLSPLDLVLCPLCPFSPHCRVLHWVNLECPKAQWTLFEVTGKRTGLQKFCPLEKNADWPFKSASFAHRVWFFSARFMPFVRRQET